MSLWTPDGERPISRETPGADQRPTPGPAAEGSLDDFDLESLSPEEQAQAQQMLAEMAEIREQVASVPASDVIANHLMGFYELGAIHLSQEPPNFAEAAVAIDALRITLDGMAGRLGDHEEVLRQALVQIQMAFVQIKDQLTGDTTAP